MASSRKSLLPDWVKRVEANLARYLVSAGPTRFCVGFSGGLDSVVLLHVLAGFCSRSGHGLFALHVHHGLSVHADDWAQFACQFAQSLGIACTVERVAVTARAELGLEAAARQARYAVYARQDCDVLLLAHHRDDQAETLLLNLLRGTGVRGLAAMPECRHLAGRTSLVRPLLDVPRSDLLAYARTHGLRWVEDDSNTDQTLDRNYLRHAVLPVLADRFPSVAQTLSRTAQHVAETDALLLELAQADLASCLVAESFCLQAGARLSVPRLRNVLRYWLQQHGIVADTRAFDALLAMMQSAREDASPCWIWRDLAVRRYRGRLYVTAARLQQGRAEELAWQPGACWLPQTWSGELCWRRRADVVGIAESVLCGRMMLRPRLGGEAMRLRPDGPMRTLKHLFQEQAVPPWQRDALPLLWIDDRLAAVPGLWVAAEFAEEGGWWPVWQPAMPSGEPGSD